MYRSERLQPVSFLRRQTIVFSLTIWMTIDWWLPTTFRWCVWQWHNKKLTLSWSSEIYVCCLEIVFFSLYYQRMWISRFAVEWVKGSRVVNVLINSSSSKMATLLLPQFYPLTGTNHIKLIKLYGYEDKAIENFRVSIMFYELTHSLQIFRVFFWFF